MKSIHGGDVYRNHVKLDFSVNVNPLGMPNGVEAALYEAVGRCNEYPDIMTEKLKKEVSTMITVPMEYLLFGNGASELFMGIVHAVRPKKILIPIPSFYGYEYAAEAVEGEKLYYPLKKENHFLPDEEFLEILTEEVDLLFFANPNNPTGRLTDKEYLVRMLSVCKSKHILVVLDECFIEFCGKESSMLSKIGEYDNVIIVRAFTKSYAIPGVRLGYLICSNLVLSEKISKQLPEWNVSALAQAAGIACVSRSTFLAKTVDYVKKERQFLEENLKALGIEVFTSDANFLLIYSERDLYELLLKQGVLIRNCENFRGLSEGYYRIAVKSRRENERLLEAIREL